MNASTMLRVTAARDVLAWLVGLFVAPARPTDEPAGAVKEYFTQHDGAALTQSLLVHGVAGVALAAFAWSLSRLADRSSGAVLSLGVAAAALSLIQVAILVSVATRTGSVSAATIDQRVGWIDTVDTAKLVALAAFALVGSMAAVASGLARGWLVPFAVVLAVLLVGGGISLLASSSLLTGALYLSLPLLLIWVGVLGVTATRDAPRATVSVSANDETSRQDEPMQSS